MNRASGNLIFFVVVMIVVPWALIWVLRSTGRRWGTGSMVDPKEAAEPARRPLRFRLNLFQDPRRSARHPDPAAGPWPGRVPPA